ncbi:hypothetical protein FVQ98_14190 [Ottowia sp. GY511]|uniref:HNH endonuclease n=1 Tax=Ottowia flava TaxID=2675430 RepID=A0ABW4KRE9_9BURK|nr:hypothetical protein [Ottowia sp. GY511]TXK26522.1 hypothetical protein FVQ98_14190 [Ottowia sp. GY511]
MKSCLICGADISFRPYGTLYCLGRCAAEANLRNGAGAAYRAVQREIAAGRMLPARHYKCVDCKKQALDWDHRDYNRPLDVEPVCRSCNKKRGPALPVGEGLFTSKQAKFVTPNFVAPRRSELSPKEAA